MRKKLLNLWVRVTSLTSVVVAVMLISGSLNAQNIAPLATATGNGSGTFTPYLWNWNQINDLSFGTCGGQEAFIWTTDPPNGTEYMEWEWTTQYAINKITIHHAETGNRFLTGGTIQYWDGANWINHYTFSSLPQVCVNDVNFPVCVTNKLRIANWVPGTGQRSNLNFREIEIWQGALPGTHATAKATYNDGKNCGTANDSIVVEAQNIGLTKIGNFYIGTQVSGTVNGVPVSYNDSVLYTDSLITAQVAKVKMFNFNSINGGQLNVKSWVHVQGDTLPKDDTISRYVTILGSPTTNPTPSDNDRCGSGSVTLSATPGGSNAIYWYDKPSGGTLVGQGKNFNTAYIAAPQTVNYYTASAKISGDSAFNFGLGGANYAGPGLRGGNMFDINVKKAITIDSLQLHLNLSNTQEVAIYIKSGSYSTATTNFGAWTFVDRVNVKARNFGSPSYMVLNKPFYLEPGNYGIYIFANENLIFEAITGNRTISNSALDVSMGVALQDTFNIVFPGSFAFNGQFYYHEACISNNRQVAKATAKPLPVGSYVVKGSTFQGTFNSGTIGDPDLVANPDQIEYELVPPTGFANSAFGTTWNIASLTVETVNGTTVPAANYTVTNPAGSANGKFLFKPTTSYTDTMVKVTMNLTRADNGCDSTVERYIFVAPRPNADFTATTACEGEVIEFDNNSSITTGTISYIWNFGDGNMSNQANPFHTYTTFGTYTAKLMVISNLGYRDSMTQTVTVYEVPKPNFDFSNACEGTAVQLNDASVLPAGTPTYVWNFGDGSPNGTGKNTAKTYANPGIYPVTLTVEVNGCSDKKTKYVTQAPRAIPAFTVDLGECDNKTVGFTNGSTAPSFGVATYLWDFGDMNQAAGIDANHTYFSFNTYTAKLYAQTDLGCIDSVTMPVTLKESPKADFTFGGGTCTNETVSYTNSTNTPAGAAGANTYNWDFGDVNTSTQDNPTHAYAAEGSYDVELTAFSTNGCQSTTVKTLVVGEKPTADFIVNKVCEGNPTMFTNNSVISSGSLNYQWDLGNGDKPTTTNATTTYASAGSYNVSLIASSVNGCSDTLSTTAEVAAIPAVDILATSANTGNGAIRFATTSTGVTYKWLFGDGGSDNVQNPTYTYTASSIWRVTLIVTSPDGCTNSTTTDVLVNALSVDNVEGGDFVVYPNPTSGIFYVRYNGQTGVNNIKVTDMLGKVIATHQPEAGSEAIAFDLSNQSAGMYFITLTDVSGNSTFQKVTLTK